MKNNIKKAPVKFREDLLYFQHFMLIFFFAQISDYHHLNNYPLYGHLLHIIGKYFREFFSNDWPVFDKAFFLPSSKLTYFSPHGNV